MEENITLFFYWFLKVNDVFLLANVSLLIYVRNVRWGDSNLQPLPLPSPFALSQPLSQSYISECK